MNGQASTARLSIVFVLAALLSGCSLLRVTHCTYWNLLPAFGIDYNPPVCPGGQPTVTTKPPPLPTVQAVSVEHLR